jgi:hypothetical protein
MEGDGTAVVGVVAVGVVAGTAVVIGVAVGTGAVGDPAMVGMVTIRTGVVTIRTIRTAPGAVIIRKGPRIT